jgi:mono/diheme cytochrome c family protein
MKNLSILCTVLVCALTACEWTSRFAPPPVTAQMARTSTGQSATRPSRSDEHADLAMLNQGRRLFVSRCIDCHTLPPFWHYSAKEWPGIVDSMAHRANLKRNERDAIVAYILAARRQ